MMVLDYDYRSGFRYGMGMYEAVFMFSVTKSNVCMLHFSLTSLIVVMRANLYLLFPTSTMRDSGRNTRSVDQCVVRRKMVKSSITKESIYF